MKTEEKRKLKVFIALPTMGTIRVELMSRLMSWTKTINGIVHASAGISPVDHARNEIVRKFLESDCTHLFFVDSDTVPPFDALAKLLKVDKPVVSGITHIYREGGIVSNCFTNVKDGENGATEMDTVNEDQGVVQIMRAGTSCMLIKREVLEVMGKKWFQNKWDEDYTYYISEDLNFCDKARALGFEIWCESSVLCEHHKEFFI